MATTIEVAKGNYVYLYDDVTGKDDYRKWSELSEEVKGKLENTLSELIERA